MRAATLDSINAPQLATTTDRLLAHDGCSKRRGPHIAQHRGDPDRQPIERMMRTPSRW